MTRGPFLKILSTFHFPESGDEDFFMKTIAYCINNLVVFSALKKNGML